MFYPGSMHSSRTPRHGHAPLSSHVWLNETSTENRDLPSLLIRWCLTFLCRTAESRIAA